MADDRHLHGGPSRRLVKEVRSRLWRYGVRPKGDAWQLTWVWATAIASSYFHFRWPMPHEIASQYMLLLLCEMKEGRLLKLPFRADEVQPEEVEKLIAIEPFVILQITPSGKQHPLGNQTKQTGATK
jgi:hypothetical protein